MVQAVTGNRLAGKAKLKIVLDATCHVASEGEVASGWHTRSLGEGREASTGPSIMIIINSHILKGLPIFTADRPKPHLCVLGQCARAGVYRLAKIQDPSFKKKGEN